jgi:hypothetical protein
MAELLDPEFLFSSLAKTIPQKLHQHMIMVGSLATAYQFRKKLAQPAVNTKDADVVIHPAGDVGSVAKIAETLLAAGWKRRSDCRAVPDPSAVDKKSVIRLNPPGSNAYYFELLALPPEEQSASVEWRPVQLSDGWYAAPSFRFLRLILNDPQLSNSGLKYGLPAMLALSNLLSHQSARSRLISNLVEGREVMRSAKDLGRVLAIAFLTGRDATEQWVARWSDALRKYFPKSHSGLMKDAGLGLEEMLRSGNEDALDEAHWTCINGLLAGKAFTIEQLRATGERLMVDVILPLRQSGTELN